jgi:hypothetical protein
MTATHSTQWFWSDWLGDQEVRRLTLAERGLWIDLLALAAVAKPYGYVCDDRGRKLPVDEIARVANCSVEMASELIEGILQKGAASRDRAGRLFNRRMVREAELSAKRKRNGLKGAEATRLKWQALQGLPRQNAWQTPRQDKAPLTIKNITTTESGTAREEEVGRGSTEAIEAMRLRLARARH